MVNYIIISVSVAFLFLAVIVINKYFKPETFDKNMIINAKNFNTDSVKYNNNVYIILGNDYQVFNDKIILNGISQSLIPNMIILGEKAPGFMREIKSISYAKNKTIILTEKVDINKVLEKANFEKTFSYQDIIKQSKNIKENFTYENTIPRSFSKHLEKITYFNRNSSEIPEPDPSPNPNVTINQTVYAGTTGITADIDFLPSIYVKLIMNNTTVHTFVLRVDGNFKSILSSYLLTQFRISRNFSSKLFPTNVAEERLSTWYISLYPGIWIEIKPSIDGNIILDCPNGNIDIQHNIEIGTKRPYSVGVYYQRQNTYSLGSSTQGRIQYISTNAEWYKNTLYSNINATTNLQVIGKIILNIDFLLWGFTGPYINVAPYIKLDTELSLDNCNESSNDYDIDLCSVLNAKGGAGVFINIGGKLFNNRLNRTIYNNYWHLWNRTIELL
jgi:hypothetical protein